MANGYILHEDSRIVVIATGLKRKSSNRKTGKMIQVWILSRHIDPVTAVTCGLDADVCFDCVHRGTTCYVQIGRAPLAIWRAYRRGRYPVCSIDDIASIFSGLKIRFGAYGDPVLIPLPIMQELARVSAGWTGYTHQWSKSVFAEYARYLMASVDSETEYRIAKSAGWRTFRVREKTAELLTGEITCPASDEAGHKSSCDRCRLCSGTYAGDIRRDIGIIVHGAGARKFQPAPALIQLAA